MKRVTQLTGHYISDPNLTSAKTLGDLYHHFCAAAKPKLTRVHKFIQVEGKRLNRKANQMASSKDASATPRQSRPHVGELLNLENVQVLRRRPNAVEERRRIGLQKAISREMKERNLIDLN
jgi:hypothetical protein